MKKTTFIIACMLLSWICAMAQTNTLDGDLFTTDKFVERHPEEMVGIDFNDETGTEGVASYFGKIGVLNLNQKYYLCFRKNERNYIASDRSGGVVRKLAVRWSPHNEDGVKINVFGLNEKLDNPRGLQLTSETFIQYKSGDETAEFIFPEGTDYTHFVLSFTGPDVSISEMAVLWENPEATQYDLSVKTTGKGSLAVTDNLGRTYTDGSKVNEGAMLSVTATPEEGSHLLLFTVNGAYYDSKPIEVKGDIRIEAVFESDIPEPVIPEPETVGVNVLKSGNGSVTISSEIGGDGQPAGTIYTDQVLRDSTVYVTFRADEGWIANSLVLDSSMVFCAGEVNDADAVTMLTEGVAGYARHIVAGDQFTVTAVFVKECIKTGAESVETDNDATAEYYNLQGVRVSRDHLSPGIYIMRTAEGSRKVTVK